MLPRGPLQVQAGLAMPAPLRVAFVNVALELREHWLAPSPMAFPYAVPVLVWASVCVCVYVCLCL
jgi:hypothetical protein